MYVIVDEEVLSVVADVPALMEDFPSTPGLPAPPVTTPVVVAAPELALDVLPPPN